MMSAELSNREQQVVQLLWEGLNNEEIGQRLGLSVKTIEMHRARIMRKLEVFNVAQLIRAAIERGIIMVELTNGGESHSDYRTAKSVRSFRRNSLISLFAERVKQLDQNEEPHVLEGRTGEFV